MIQLDAACARRMLEDVLANARAARLAPLSVVIMDDRGAPIAMASEDGVSLARWRIALAKASGAMALGLGSRKLNGMAVDRPHFIGSLASLCPDGIIPVPGGVLIRDAQSRIIGAVGVSGDTSDNDEAVSLAAIKAAGFSADPG